MKPFTRDQYASDLSFALYMALAFTLLAAIPLLLAGGLNLFNALRGRPLELPWRTYLLMWLVVPGSYVAAALSGGTVAFLLRPWRVHFLGWCLTGAAVAACIYGSVGLALAIFYDPVGAAFLEHSSREEAWDLIPFMLVVLAPVGALVGGYIGWRDRQGRSIW